MHTGIKLDGNGSYCEGGGIIETGNQNLLCPPEARAQLYTETFDSYCLGHILYLLFTGELVDETGLEMDTTAGMSQPLWHDHCHLRSKCKQLINEALSDSEADR